MEAWEVRFVAEYNELKTRREKLGTMLEKWKAGKLEFTPKNPYWLLEAQYNAMMTYESILRMRSEIEGIDL